MVNRHAVPGMENSVDCDSMDLCDMLIYRDVMCLPALKQHVYSALNPKATPAMETVEARLNVMQTVFLAMQSQPSPSLAEPTDSLLTDSQQIFQTLFSRHFNEDMEVRAS